MTQFSIYNLDRNNSFDYSKAQRELGFKCRGYTQTIIDEAKWLGENGFVKN